jgi:hypothetical protein
MHRWRREAILDCYNLVLGTFLFVSPWLFVFARDVARVDVWVTSALLVSISIATLVAFAEWEEWASLVVGLWMVVSPWVLGFPQTTAMHVIIGVGCVVIYLAALELWLIHYSPHLDEGVGRQGGSR